MQDGNAKSETTDQPQCAVLDKQGKVTMSWPAHRVGDSLICLASDRSRTHEQNVVSGAIVCSGVAIAVIIAWLAIKQYRATAANLKGGL